MTKNIIHVPVLVDQVLHYLDPQPGKVYLDVTFGAGGHTRALLQHQKQCTVIAVDWEQEALEVYGTVLQQEFGNRLKLVWGNFALLYKILKKEGVQSVDGIIADFGPSTIQLKGKKGFSFASDTPLDMRMSPAHQKITAAEVVNNASEGELRYILWEFGQEQYAKQIVRALITSRKQRAITTTAQLAQIIMHVKPRGKSKIHPATKSFQALRIFVNKELENITSFLASTLHNIKPGGKLICISFHSLEDRLVKKFFAEQEQRGALEILTPKAITASAEELQYNPSSRSARLRAAVYR